MIPNASAVAARSAVPEACRQVRQLCVSVDSTANRHRSVAKRVLSGDSGTQKHDCLGFTGLPFSHRPNSFSGFKLDGDFVDGEFKDRSKTFSNRAPVFFQFRALQQDAGIDIHKLPAEIARQPERVLQKLAAGGVLPFRSGVRKVHTDIAQGKRAQHRIGHCVEEHVGVGMSGEPEFRRYLNAA